LPINSQILLKYSENKTNELIKIQYFGNFSFNSFFQEHKNNIYLPAAGRKELA